MLEKFSNERRCYHTALKDLTLEELAAEIRRLSDWDADLLRELCGRADMIEEWEAADGETFESVVYAAAEKLGVELFDSERFVCDERTGEEISGMSTEELASDIRYDYAHGNSMNKTLARDLCWRAGMISAWDSAAIEPKSWDETREKVLLEAADALGVDVAAASPEMGRRIDYSMSDESLAFEIRVTEWWDSDFLYELCWRADMEREYMISGEHFEWIVSAAAEKLGVKIYADECSVEQDIHDDIECVLDLIGNDDIFEDVADALEDIDIDFSSRQTALAAIKQMLEDADEDTLSLFEDVDEIAPLCKKLLELKGSEK